MDTTAKKDESTSPHPSAPSLENREEPKDLQHETATEAAEKTDDAGFKNYLVRVEDSDLFLSINTKQLQRIFTYADRTSWTLNILAFVAAIAAGVALPLMDLVFGKFVTQFTNFATGVLSPAGYRDQVTTYSLYFVYLFVAKFALTYVHTVCISIAAIRTTKALRIDFVKQLLRQNVAYFDSESASSVAIQTTTNSNNVNTGISEKLTLTIAGVSTFLAAFVVAFAVQWKLTLITIGIVPVIMVVVGICAGIDVKIEDQMLSTYDRASMIAEEVFATMRTVHSFWLHPLLSKRYAKYLDDAKTVGMRKSRVYVILFSTEFFCTYAGYGLAFWQGTRMYARGEITESGDVVTVIFAVIVAATAMTTIAPQILTVTKAAGAAGALFRVIDRESEIDAMSEEGKRPTSFSGRIQVRNVHFAYPARKHAPVLQGLDLDIPAGKTTALVGASGSGKSTIIGLLERWYDFSEGQILVDGEEIRDLNVGWLRTNIRLVQQEPVLFNGTVFENVAFGLLGTEHASLSQEEQMKLVKQACKSAYADEFIERLPAQYDTHVGERAMMLSGGQKQRLAIARSIISDPRILLLDEATSALDPKAEKIVQEALDNVSANRTTLVIAHKLSTVRNADNIAVMSKGAIIEQGTHEELIAAKGAYARLVTAQDLGHADSSEEAAEETQVEEKSALIRSDTKATSIHSTAVKEDTKNKSLGYSLIKCVGILLYEQRELWPAYSVVLIVALVGGASFPVMAILFSRAVTVFQITDRAEMVDRGDFWALMFFVLAIVIWFTYGALGWVSNLIAQTCSRRYRYELFVNSLGQDMDYFDRDENGTGAIVSRLSSYPNNILELMGGNLMLISINVVNVVASSILGIATGWKLGLATVFGALPPMLFCGYLRIRLEVKLDEMTSKRFESSASVASEAIAAIRTVSSLTLEKHILHTYQDRLANVAGQSITSLLWTMFWYSLTQSINFAAMALGFWYGGQLVSTGEYNNEQFFVVFTAIIFSGEAAAAFFSYTTSITKAQIAANYIFWSRKQIPTIRERPDLASNEKHDGTGPVQITSENLSFSYLSRPNAKVIQDINIDVQPGQFVAFVGASGCGKSTMIALLERFYDPTDGRILRDRTDIASLCPRQYRRHIALVQQEPILYQGSIRDNIAMGLEDADAATDAQIADASRQANIYDFVSSLPSGFATACGSRGTQLSGGQRQRIAIARALIRQPRLLLLDEATSALDTESEKIVQLALERAQSGRTTIAVAHRLSTIKDADAIFVFRSGRIIETGSHAELLARRGVYYEMCLGQSLDQAV